MSREEGGNMDEDRTHLWVCASMAAVLLVGAVAGSSIDAMQQGEKEEAWHSHIKAANAMGVAELEHYFDSWKEDVVLKDGAVEQWSGSSSDVLFIESEQRCDLHEEHFWVPCWTVWARTKDSRRYYKVVIRIDVDDHWRLKSEGRHTEVDLHHVITRALSLGREDVVRKVGATRMKA